LRYLILSDVHSNLEALDVCLSLADGKHDQVLCLGDLVGYGPDPNAVIDRIRKIAAVVIRGNHDKASCGVMDTEEFNQMARLATDWTREQLTPEHSDFLRNLPPGPVLMDRFELVHGSPVDEDEYILGSIEAVSALHQMTKPIVFFGHTHYQGGFQVTRQNSLQAIVFGPLDDGVPHSVAFTSGGRYLINPGSVGQPRDGDWRAAFCIFDQDQMRTEFYRTPYDIEKTQAKMRAANLPEPLVRRLELGR
jgi:predicted phosphodiesterase